MGARTIEIKDSVHDCELCKAEGVNPPKKLKAVLDCDSSGIGQRMCMRCDKHGNVKKLYNFPVDPVNKKLFIELFEDEYGPIAPEPKPTTWV